MPSKNVAVKEQELLQEIVTRRRGRFCPARLAAPRFAYNWQSAFRGKVPSAAKCSPRKSAFRVTAEMYRDQRKPCPRTFMNRPR